MLPHRMKLKDMLSDYTFMRYIESSHSMGQKVEWRWPRVWEEERMGVIVSWIQTFSLGR